MREQGITRGQIFLTTEDTRFLTSLYDEKVQRADEEIAVFFERYDKTGLKDKTIFVITSHHGEELYEHGRIDHGHSLYEELIRIPIIIIVPDLKDKIVIDSQVTNIDILPTLLTLLDFQKNRQLYQQFQGESMINIQRKKNYALIETDYRYATFKRGVRKSDGWKYIVDLDSGDEELYNLEKDPGEKNNLIMDAPQKLQELKNLLQL